MSRRKKLILNTTTSIAYEVVAIICAFILPRLILQNFGSATNGLVSAVQQFIAYAALLKSGIGGVTRAALYKPLAEKNDFGISEIINATSSFMRKVAFIFLGLLFVLALIIPLVFSNDFDFLFSASLVVIIGLSTFVQYYFSVTYQMLLKADQKEYIYTIISTITTVLNTIVGCILILIGGSLHTVYVGSALVFLIIPIAMNWYVARNYNIDEKVPANNKTIEQRWDSFAHQLANFVHGNVAVFVLTIFTSAVEISVFSVYRLIIHAIQKGVTSLTVGLEALLGNMLACKEETKLHNTFDLFEWSVYNIATIAIALMLHICVPFAMFYTKGVYDVDYERYVFASIFLISVFFFCVRIPYEAMVRASGHYRQTRNGAILEPCINVVISMALTPFYGITGVAIGAACSMCYRTFQYIVYVQKNLMKRSVLSLAKIWVQSSCVILCSVFLIRCWSFGNLDSMTDIIIACLYDIGIIGVVSIVFNILLSSPQIRLAYKFIKKK